MEEYKQSLIRDIEPSCDSMEKLHKYIIDDKRYDFIVNENGLHSTYNGRYYTSALACTYNQFTHLYWLFDGDIKDCTHPFHVCLGNGNIHSVDYHSSERIIEGKPIKYIMHNSYVYLYYNTIGCGIIMDGYKTGVEELSRSEYAKSEHALNERFYMDWEDTLINFKFAD